MRSPRFASAPAGPVTLGVLLAAAGLISYHAGLDVVPRMAWGGFGPEHYVWNRLAPDLFAADFRNGIAAYDVSLVMQVYVWAASWLGVDPTATAYPFVTGQALLLTYASWHLGTTVGRRPDTALLIAGVLLVSHLPGTNLANFGLGLQSSIHPLYYGYANGFKLLALSYHLRDRVSPAAAFLALAALCHLTLALGAGIFMAGYYLLKPPELVRPRVLVPLATAGLVVGAHLLLGLSGKSIGAGGMTSEEYLTATRSFSRHWHPLAMGFFSDNFHRAAGPVLFAVAVLWLCCPPRGGDRPRIVRIWSGTVLVGLVSAVGVVLSDVMPVVVFVKLCLQRSTDTLTIVAVAVATGYLWHLVRRPRRWSAVPAAAALVALAGPGHGIALLPWAGVAAFQAMRNHLGPYSWRTGALARKAIGAAATAVLCAFAVGVSWAWPRFALTGGLPPIRYAIGLAVLIAMGFVASRQWKRASPAWAGLGSAAFAASVVLLVWFGQDSRYQPGTRPWRSALQYRDAQLWARANTAPGTVFLIDPSHTYGWRDYARRPSFGTYREWGLFGFAYDSSRSAYEEGLRRFALFGVDPRAVAAEIAARGDRLSLVNAVVGNQIERAFNRRSIDQLLEIARSERVGYIVLFRDRYKGDRGSNRPAFSNGAVEIYAVTPGVSS